MIIVSGGSVHVVLKTFMKGPNDGICHLDPSMLLHSAVMGDGA